MANKRLGNIPAQLRDLDNTPEFDSTEFDAAKERAELGLPEVKLGRPRKTDIVRDNAAQAGMTAEWTRATFIVRCDVLKKFKDFAYSERIPYKQAINEALEGYLSDKTNIVHEGEGRQYDPTKRK